MKSAKTVLGFIQKSECLTKWHIPPLQLLNNLNYHTIQSSTCLPFLWAPGCCYANLFHFLSNRVSSSYNA